MLSRWAPEMNQINEVDRLNLIENLHKANPYAEARRPRYGHEKDGCRGLLVETTLCPDPRFIRVVCLKCGEFYDQKIVDGPVPMKLSIPTGEGMKLDGR